MKQQRDGAAETSRNDKLRVAWERLGNTRARRANTANRAPDMPTHHRHVRVHVCTSSIQWEIQTNPYQSSETTTCNTNVTAPLKPQENEQITSCLGSDGQHARPSCKHCKACAKHAHAPPPRARTRLYKFHSVGISHQPLPVQCNNDLKQQRGGAAETSRNDKLRVAWERLGNTRAGRANTANRAPHMLTHHHHVRVHVCTSFIQWEIQTNTYQSRATTT